MTRPSMVETFNVYWYDPQGECHCEGEALSVGDALEKAISFTNRPANLLGIIRRVIITDASDMIAWEWTAQSGMVYPPQNGPQSPTNRRW